MSTPIEKLDELIEAYNVRLREAQQRLKDAERSFREAQANANSIESELRGLTSARMIVSRSQNYLHHYATHRARSLSLTWKQILQFIASKGDRGATIDEIDQFVASSGYAVQRTAIRSQLSNYKQRGVLELVADAQYKLTKQGAELVTGE